MGLLLLFGPGAGGGGPGPVDDTLRFVIQAAFGSYPNDASYDWTTIHDTDASGEAAVDRYVRGVHWERGIHDLTGRMQTGKSRLTIRNFDRAWDPANPDSNFYPDVIPDLPFRGYAEINGNTYYLWTHYADDVSRHRLAPAVAEGDIDCSDGFEGLALATIKPDIASLTTNFTGLDNDLVFTAREAGTAAHEIQIAFIVHSHDDVRIDTDGNLIQIFWHLEHSGGDPTSTANDVIAALEAHPQAMELVSVALAPGNDGTGDVEDMAATNLSGGDAAAFPAETTGERIERALDWADWPAALRDLGAGTRDIVAAAFSSDEQGNMLSHVLDVAGILGEGGYVYCDGQGKIKFLDRETLEVTMRDPVCTFVEGLPRSSLGAGEYLAISLTPTYGKTRLWNEWTGTVEGSVALRVSDENSQAQFRRRVAGQLNTLLTSERALRSRLQNLLLEYAFPTQRIESIVVKPGNDDALLEVCLGLDIGQRVRVKEYPPGGGDPNDAVYTVIALAGDGPTGKSLYELTFTYILWPVKYEVAVWDDASSVWDSNSLMWAE